MPAQFLRSGSIRSIEPANTIGLSLKTLRGLVGARLRSGVADSTSATVLIWAVKKPTSPSKLVDSRCLGSARPALYLILLLRVYQSNRIPFRMKPSITRISTTTPR